MQSKSYQRLTFASTLIISTVKLGGKHVTDIGDRFTVIPLKDNVSFHTGDQLPEFTLVKPCKPSRVTATLVLT